MKRVFCLCIVSPIMSLPSRERGLKRDMGEDKSGYLESLPSRERGLKLVRVLRRVSRDYVAPFAGAWIETFPCVRRFRRVRCRSLRGSVD